jgi:hypothetical protein
MTHDIADEALDAQGAAFVASLMEQGFEGPAWGDGDPRAKEAILIALRCAWLAGPGPAAMEALTATRNPMTDVAPAMLDELILACGGKDAPLSDAPVTISANLAHGLLATLGGVIGAASQALTGAKA